MDKLRCGVQLALCFSWVASLRYWYQCQLGSIVTSIDAISIQSFVCHCAWSAHRYSTEITSYHMEVPCTSVRSHVTVALFHCLPSSPLQLQAIYKSTNIFQKCFLKNFPYHHQIYCSIIPLLRAWPDGEAGNWMSVSSSSFLSSSVWKESSSTWGRLHRNAQLCKQAAAMIAGMVSLCFIRMGIFSIRKRCFRIPKLFNPYPCRNMSGIGYPVLYGPNQNTSMLPIFGFADGNNENIFGKGEHETQECVQTPA